MRKLSRSCAKKMKADRSASGLSQGVSIRFQFFRVLRQSGKKLVRITPESELRNLIFQTKSQKSCKPLRHSGYKGAFFINTIHNHMIRTFFQQETGSDYWFPRETCRDIL